ncbi:MAG TPA: ABC transporter, partial [Rhodospirillaceae bacterium]|nr:ABC transporter [Rhodospirillaceae bacterium]
MLSIQNITYRVAGRALLENVSLNIPSGHRVGLVGANGCGKSTLFKLISGELAADDGTVSLMKKATLGVVRQDFPEDGLSLLEIVLAADEERAVLLAEAETSQDMNRIGYIYERLTEINAYEAPSRAASILAGLGFDEMAQAQTITSFSGGWRARVALACVLFSQPTVLLLDEPTNHLDLDTIEWFQDYLSNYKGTIIFVTHDRYFLDAVSDKIMEMENGQINFFKGNYSYYLRKKEQQDIDVQRKETRRKAQLKKEIKWLKRGARARTSKPKDHLDRVKELIDKSYLSENKDLDISFKTKRLGKTILEIKNITKQYDDNILFSNFNHNFQKLERIGIIGPNGCGKTTLLKCIMEEIDPDNGSIKIGVNTSFSYFQQNIEEFDNNQTVLDYIQEFAHNIRTADGVLHSASEMLQRFLFDGKMQQSRLE